MRRVSRNKQKENDYALHMVTPRMRRVSRNIALGLIVETPKGHASHEACE